MTLSTSDILRVWELGQGQPSWYRALLMLAPALPHLKQPELAALSLGRRNAYLLALRSRLLGPILAAFVRCPCCSEPLEFTVNVADLCQVDPARPLEPPQLTIGETEVSFRLLNSQDLAAIASYHDIPTARQALIGRCIVQAWQNGREVAAADLSETAIAALGDRLTEYDPQAETRLNFDCPACSYNWSADFDIVSFLWSEISVQAKRLLSEVHTLARAYGWREQDILSMSTVRRQYYLEQVV